MPTLPVNHGCTKFHKFCNFIDRINATQLKFFHVNIAIRMQDQILYNVELEVIYNNSDHIEKGVIKMIENKNEYTVPQ